jgi:tRNA(His) guanylyltransferase
MKECEIFSSFKVPCGSKIVLRLDGRGFYRLSQSLGLKKPYDARFAESMVNTAIQLFREFSPSFLYTFSDEFNVLLSEIPFSGRLEKLNSIFASFTATSFLFNLVRNLALENEEIRNKDLFEILQPISFDCRLLPLSPELMVDYFKSRQDEAWRNCINGYAYWTLREEMDQKEAVTYLKGLKSAQIHDILFERGINIAEVPAWQRRGVGIYKIEQEIEGFNPQIQEKVSSVRKKITTDWDLPFFDKEFFKINIK